MLLRLFYCLFTNYTVLKPWVSSSKLNEILSVFLIKIAKSVLFSLIRSQCVVTRTKLSPLTPKAMNCASMIMSKKLTTKCVSILAKSSKVVFTCSFTGPKRSCFAYLPIFFCLLAQSRYLRKWRSVRHACSFSCIPSTERQHR